MPTFFVQNFGCRATQADGAALEALLAARGLEPAAQRFDLLGFGPNLGPVSELASVDNSSLALTPRMH